MTDGNTSSDLFLYDRVTDTLSLVSHSAASATAAANQGTSRASMAAGAKLAFVSSATDLVSGITDTNSAPDVFVFDLASGVTSLVSYSAASSTTTSNKNSLDAVISADGNVVIWLSNSTNL